MLRSLSSVPSKWCSSGPGGPICSDHILVEQVRISDIHTDSRQLVHELSRNSRREAHQVIISQVHAPHMQYPQLGSQVHEANEELATNDTVQADVNQG